MNKKTILIVEAIVGVLILIGAIFLLLPKEKAAAPVTEPSPSPSITVSSGIEIFSPKVNETILSPLKITGVVNGNGWSGFEGQVGTVRLLDNGGNELAKGVLKATTEWTQLPTQFETTITFTATSGSLGSLVFKNENASGDPVRDKTFTLPVTFK